MKFLGILIITFLFGNINNFANASVTGAADVYKIKMHKVELCTGHTAGDFDDASTSTTQCQNAVVIGESAAGVEVDIASVTAGQAAGSFGNPALLPLGETYTHLRVHINRNMTIRTASGIDTGDHADTDNCITIATTDAMYGTTEAARKYTHVPVISENGTKAEMSMYLRDGLQAGEAGNSFKMCQALNCGSTDDQAWHYPANAATLTSAVAMQTMRSTVSTDQVALIYALSKPFTVTLNPPKIDMAFGTSAAISADTETVSGASTVRYCKFAIQEPIVTITIK